MDNGIVLGLLSLLTNFQFTVAPSHRQFSVAPVDINIQPPESIGKKAVYVSSDENRTKKEIAPLSDPFDLKRPPAVLRNLQNHPASGIKRKNNPPIILANSDGQQRVIWCIYLVAQDKSRELFHTAKDTSSQRSEKT
ncbi:hypothetical protein BDB00DRAFT_790990 [Zychaea mexicana]|uniref:uncharacterized protein n=1 Tax=Zychaea mexicana TaxID=64656 RepID=UPI0022FDD6E3|nr:uncharacterized protein BDB00DRAFT_790990 [Zychaea mexicana]KAI9489571.1 hypothetical protein BDB00DRAFT_790990 [Zychaea mexicana]